VPGDTQPGYAHGARNYPKEMTDALDWKTAMGDR
jgi:hypothetical protein